MRSEQEIRDLFARAMKKTSAQAARISLVLPGENQNWLILLRSGSDELAINVADLPGSSDEALESQIEDQLKRLF